MAVAAVVVGDVAEDAASKNRKGYREHLTREKNWEMTRMISEKRLPLKTSSKPSKQLVFCFIFVTPSTDLARRTE